MDFKVMEGLMMRKFRLFFVCFILFQTVTFSQQVSLDGLSLMGNKTGLVSVNRKQLNGIFRGNQSIWKTNEQVIVVMPSSKAEFADQFAKSVLQMSHSALQKYWLALVFQGRANAPVFLNSSAEIIDYVKKNPGAIAIVKSTEREIPAGMSITITDR
jgi:ABC-type phosphate transport system substrate-binding protein